MPPEEFERASREVFEWMGEYLADPSTHAVLSEVEPGEVLAALPPEPPESGEEFSQILRDFRDLVLPGITHWNHPGFFAYFSISGSVPGVLAEALVATLNVNAMLWRTSPAATELEERVSDWTRQLLGLPPEFRGHIQDTASTSTLVSLATAREATGLGVRDAGLSGRDVPALRLYCSEEAHSSVEKAAITIGIGRSSVNRIATDSNFRMRPSRLIDAIEADLAQGARPFCIVATVGTTSTTSVDPIAEVAAIARQYDLWLHIDAAYGGAAAAIPEMRHLMAGWEQADSIVVNPHKWLFVPIDCSLLLLRDPAATRSAFSLVPEYLETPESDRVTNLMDYGPALGRRFRALKLWMTLRYFGTSGIAERLRKHIALARDLADSVEAEESWVLAAPVPFSTVCLRYDPGHLTGEQLDRANEQILERVNASGEVFLSHTRLRERYTLRVAIGNIRTEKRHVQRAWELLREAAEVV
ncbi:MAG: amino acid decarboxylase [Gemmatimonas sp.]|nr:amino acid decarboxylase [Gemmatimonas sp.]